MARTTGDAVQAVLGVNYDSVRVPSLTPFIDLATLTVDELIVRAAALDPAVTISDARAEIIERYLAAHNYTWGPDPLYKSRSTMGGSGSFVQDDKGAYLALAKQADISGLLGGLVDPAKKVQAFWGGKPEIDRLSYSERNDG